jgi:hypothetical protein
MIASGPVRLKSLTGPLNGMERPRGMAMKTKEKLFLVWILVVVAIGILVSHFYGGAVHALEHLVACRFVSPEHLAKISAGISGIGVLP